TTSNRIEVTRELAFTNNAAPQAGEGAEKAETDLTFDLVEASVVTVAHWQKVSKQVLDDQPALTKFLDRRLRYGVQLAEESQIVTGNGSGSNMSGLLENATSFNLDVTGAPKTDVIRRAIEQLELADWSATAILMNPGDWSEIVRLKDDESRYLFTSPRAATPPQLWGVPVVPTNSMPSGEFLVGDFTAAAILWDRMSPAVEMFEQDEDNVQRNLVTVRAEMRSTVTVVRPSALVKGSFGE
ncbi:phage major capsid protein, partial [Thioalkalivibrio sp. ALJ15]|uniref:phage major capsid protein n=1 Tax=Thioalkalivibrio sp. ALJ15 TaxID=748652 RepID=UPI0003798A41